MIDILQYAEEKITIFHQQRLDTVSTKMDFNKLIEQKIRICFEQKTY